MKKLKKGWRAAALLLCCVAFMGMHGVTALAACSHANWGSRAVYYPAEPHNATQCKKKYFIYAVCNVCGDEVLVDTGYKYISHNFKTSSVTCNGKHQTIRSVCTYCGYSKTEMKLCPAGPHANGSCPALPLSVGPEELIK